MASSPVLNFRASEPDAAEIPFWAREVAASLTRRPSRASSLVSTRTRISTTTLQDDARSIDLNIAGQHFRISRDGSRVTSANIRDTLPPYWSTSGRTVTGGDRLQPQTSSDWGEESETTIVPAEEITDLPSPPGYQDSTISSASSLDDIVPSLTDSEIPDYAIMGQYARDSVVPAHQESITNTQMLGTTNELNRNPSYKNGEETMTVAKTASARQRRTVSQNDVLETANRTTQRKSIDHPLRRRNGIRLPALVTSLSENSIQGEDSPMTAISSSPRSRFTRSAGPVLASHNRATSTPQSPVFYGRAATGVFPTSQALKTADRLLWAKTVILKFWRSHRQREGQDAPRTPIPRRSEAVTEIVEPPTPVAAVPEEWAEQHLPRAMDSVNDISDHYTRMIRFIDRDHRRVLHARDKDMEELRERLHEKDIVYRQELRARDFLIEDLKKRLSHLEQSMEVKLERARHEVENTWESRWKDRDFHLMDRMHRMEAEMQKTIQITVSENEQLWRAKYEELGPPGQLGS